MNIKVIIRDLEETSRHLDLYAECETDPNKRAGLRRLLRRLRAAIVALLGREG